MDDTMLLHYGWWAIAGGVVWAIVFAVLFWIYRVDVYLQSAVVGLAVCVAGVFAVQQTGL